MKQKIKTTTHASDPNSDPFKEFGKTVCGKTVKRQKISSTPTCRGCVNTIRGIVFRGVA